MLLLAVVMAVVGSADATLSNSTTYLYTDPSTGQELTCDRCPPGYHLHAHCTATHKTMCNLCPDGLYTECWNYVPECLLCDACSENQVVKQACSPAHNKVCECGEGYYWRLHYCRKHAICASGYGVKSKGTPYKNTECELCQSGFYASGGPGSATCVEHTNCESRGQRAVLKGINWHDNICASCEELRAQGWVPFLQVILPDFFDNQKMSLGKVQRFVRKFLLVDGKKAQRSAARKAVAQLSMADLLQRIRSWVSQADAKEVTRLPKMLREAQIHNAEEKLERKIARLEREVNHCNNTTVRN